MASEDSAETLTKSTWIDQGGQLESTSVSASSSSSPPSDLAPPTPTPPITKSLSNSRLNAKAPEFIPRSTTPSSSSTVTSPSSITSGSAPTLLHVYQPVTRPAGPNHFPHAPVQGHYAATGVYHVPVQFNRQYYSGYAAADDQQHEALAGATSLVGSTKVDSDQGAGGSAAGRSRNGSRDEASQKLLNQVEYYFSDLNLATTDHLIRFMNKDPEGYVPISVVASFKKIKSLMSSNSHLADILRSSDKLMVSEDGKKVKRRVLLTQSDMEDLQSRIIVAENLPEDHCHQTLMRIFSSIGSVKTIRTCQPQASNGSVPASRATKSDAMHLSTKLHAYVEYESVEIAERAVAQLNDENNWRNGLKVSLLFKPKGKSCHGHAWSKKSGGGHEKEKEKEKDNETSTSEDVIVLQSDVRPNETGGEDDKVGQGQGQQQKKTRNRSRGKGRGRAQYNNNRGSIMGSPPILSINMNYHHHQPTSMNKQQSSVPRMPDGTKGFSMGRGKPLAIKIA